MSIAYRMGAADGVHEATPNCARPDCRPVVVIDPEDRAQVERLCAKFLLGEAGSDMGNVDDLQAGLRSLIAPPRPEEPTGLGAVVATEDDGDYIRVSVDVLNPWLNVQSGSACRWDAVAAVRVLSEGVTL